MPSLVGSEMCIRDRYMGTHIYIRNFGGKWYLVRLGTIPSVTPFLATVVAPHMCYTLVSIALSLLFLGNTFPWSRVLRDMLTFLSLFAMKGPFTLGSLPLVTNATYGGASDFYHPSSISRCFENFSEP